MNSRTTKQAARAYQKAHGVPYTEALRRVQAAREAPAAAPVEQPLRFTLGTGTLPETGFTPTTPVPLHWTPEAESLPADGSKALCVYGGKFAGKTAYLAALVREHLADRPVVVFTERPDMFPDGPNIEFAEIVRGTDSSDPYSYVFGQELFEHFHFTDPDYERVFVYDLSPCAINLNDELEALVDCPHAALLYSSTDLDTEGNPTMHEGRFGRADGPYAANEVTVFLAPSGRADDGSEGWVERRFHNIRIPLQQRLL